MTASGFIHFSTNNTEHLGPAHALSSTGRDKSNFGGRAAASSALVQFGAEGQSGRGGGGGRAQLRLSLFPSITANGFDICVSIKSAPQSKELLRLQNIFPTATSDQRRLGSDCGTAGSIGIQDIHTMTGSVCTAQSEWRWEDRQWR